LIFTSHGATSGQLDEDELFYLRTRGIPFSVAQRLIVTGFLDEVIQRLNHPAIAAHLQRLIEEKFAAQGVNGRRVLAIANFPDFLFDHGYFGASEATIFSKRGSIRSGSRIGFTRTWKANQLRSSIILGSQANA
jgi:hypothetical protein